MKLQHTKVSALIAVSALAAAVGWSIAKLWPEWTSTQFAVPVLTPIVLWGLFAFLLAWTLMVRANLKKVTHPNKLDPIVTARSAALALSSSRAAAVAFGFYAGVLLLAALTLDTPASHRCVVITSITVLAALLVMIIGLWLERICRLPDDGDNTPGGFQKV